MRNSSIQTLKIPRYVPWTKLIDSLIQTSHVMIPKISIIMVTPSNISADDNEWMDKSRAATKPFKILLLVVWCKHTFHTNAVHEHRLLFHNELLSWVYNTLRLIGFVMTDSIFFSHKCLYLQLWNDKRWHISMKSTSEHKILFALKFLEMGFK